MNIDLLRWGSKKPMLRRSALEGLDADWDAANWSVTCKPNTVHLLLRACCPAPCHSDTQHEHFSWCALMFVMVSGIACALWPPLAPSAIPAIGYNTECDLVPMHRMGVPYNEET